MPCGYQRLSRLRHCSAGCVLVWVCLCAIDPWLVTLSYDLLNEPLPGNFYNNPSLVYPGNADLYVLQPM